MSIQASEYYNIFSTAGTIPQVEYALKRIQKHRPIVCLSTNDLIVVAAKKTQTEKLEIRTEKLFYEVQKNVYCSLTGIPADIQYMISRIVSIASSLKSELGYTPPADVICKSVAEKLQLLIQSTGERVCSFSAIIFGFDKNESLVFQTDCSAVCLPFYALGVGKNSSKSNKFLEKNYKDNLSNKEAVEVAIEALVKPLDNDFFPSDLEVSVFKRDGSIIELSENEINDVISVISERD